MWMGDYSRLKTKMTKTYKNVTVVLNYTVFFKAIKIKLWTIRMAI